MHTYVPLQSDFNLQTLCTDIFTVVHGLAFPGYEPIELSDNISDLRIYHFYLVCMYKFAWYVFPRRPMLTVTRWQAICMLSTLYYRENK